MPGCAGKKNLIRDANRLVQSSAHRQTARVLEW